MAEPNAPPKYLHDIPSYHELNPGLPAVLGNMDLNRPIRRDEVLDVRNIVNAEKVVKGLQAAMGGLP